MGKWFNKLKYIQTIKHNSIIKMSVLLIDKTTWKLMLSKKKKKKKANLQKLHTVFFSIYVTFPKWQNYRNGGQVSHCKGLRLG